MSAWRYEAPASDDATKTVNGFVFMWCKYRKFRATGKVGFYTKRSSSDYTFPQRTSNVTETPSPEKSPAPAVETSTVETL